MTESTDHIDYKDVICSHCRHLGRFHYPSGSCTGSSTCICLDFEPSTEVRSESSTGGQKGVKPERYDLIPIEALDIMARLYGFGAVKYAAHNWRKGYDWSKSYASLMRHATRFWAGEDFDEETGLPHLAGAAFHCFTLMVFMQEHPDFDDRFKRDIQKVMIPLVDGIYVDPTASNEPFGDKIEED